MNHDANQNHIKTVPYRGAGEKQFEGTRLSKKQPSPAPYISDWNKFEHGHAALFKKYMDAVASGDSLRSSVAAREYREALQD